jgi:hypothetical protein
MGKASRRKRESIDEALSNQDKHKKEFKAAQKFPPKAGFQETFPIMNFIPILILLLFSFSVYFNAFFGDFVYDDKSQILDNPWIKDFRYIPTIFSSGVWSFQPGLVMNFYRPLMHIVYLFSYYVFGLNPWGFHLANILFHSGTSVLVFLVIQKLLTMKQATSPPAYISSPFIAAMLFASHPIHTEAVTWIAGLPDVAFTFFYLLSLYLYILFRDGAKKVYLLSILSFSFATLFKEPALTLPVILIVYDYQLKKSDENISARIKRYTPYVAVSVVYLLMRYYALRSFAPRESYAGLSTYQLIINVFPLFRDYLTSLLWPFKLNFWHTFHPIGTLSEANGTVSIMVTVVFIVVALVAYKKNKIFFFGLLLLIIPLLPTFYIKAISGKPYAERYLYLPSVGYVILLAVFLSWARDRLPRAARSIAIVFIIVCGLYTVETIIRNNVWKDDFHLWSDTVRKSPDCAIAHNNLATAYVSRGQLDRAVEEVQTVLRLEPDSANAHISLGNLYEAQGQSDKAIKEYQKALRLNPYDYNVRKEAQRHLDDIGSRQR